MGWLDVLELLSASWHGVPVSAEVMTAGNAYALTSHRISGSATFQRHLRNALGTPQGQTARMGTHAARSWHRRRHGGGMPLLDAGCADTSIEARTPAGYAILRGRVPIGSQTGGMDSVHQAVSWLLRRRRYCVATCFTISD